MIDRKQKIFLERFGKNLKAKRESRGMSLRDLSYACNIDNSKISKIEQGKINITLATVFELCIGLDVPVTDLLSLKKTK
jgi:transcriptional regulator with XRE-family HTH domain